MTVHAVKELDESLFDAYIERKSDPIVGSLEPGIYAGHFDWRDCGTPTGIHTHRSMLSTSIGGTAHLNRRTLCAMARIQTNTD